VIAFVVLAACLLALPAVLLGIECFAALLPLRRHAAVSADEAGLRYVVLVPAHNEAEWVARTVERIRVQVVPGTEIIVIADNCSDATASQAAAVGANVWERNDPTQLGKAYAMNFAFERLAADPPDAVVCIDADCVPGPNSVQKLAALAHRYQQPVQAAYGMQAPEGRKGLSQISALAVFVKNVIRPRGLQRLRLPCLLNGSGMAFPWAAIAAVRYPEEHLADDYRLTSDMAIAGFLPMPCMELSVMSVLPDGQKGFLAQRTRWEQGHLAVALFEPPRMLAGIVRRRAWRGLALIAEMVVPPLSFLVGFTVVCAVVLGVSSYLLGSWVPLACYLGGSAIGVLGLTAVWWREGRQILPGNVVLQIPKYVAVKAPLYSRFVTNRQRTWLRTDRGSMRIDTGHAVEPATEAGLVTAE
jgi:cellulose synthase/poly-beta-1,6-N-acetylglucosamine synthase-like glycosyltransferase